MIERLLRHPVCKINQHLNGVLARFSGRQYARWTSPFPNKAISPGDKNNFPAYCRGSEKWHFGKAIEVSVRRVLIARHPSQPRDTLRKNSLLLFQLIQCPPNWQWNMNLPGSGSANGLAVLKQTEKQSGLHYSLSALSTIVSFLTVPHRTQPHAAPTPLRDVEFIL